MTKRMQVYETDGIAVTFDPNVCVHLGLRRLRSVFVMSAALAIGTAACGSQMVQQRWSRVPDAPQPGGPVPDVRGSDSTAAAFAPEEQLQIYRTLVRGFYRPTRGQARWVDPRLLAHRRSREADSASPPDPELAAAIVATVDLPRVCRADEASSMCDGRMGGVLRFSAPYAGTADTAIVYARYSAVGGGDVAQAVAGFEQEFRLVHDGHDWRIAGRRTVAAPPVRQD